MLLLHVDVRLAVAVQVEEGGRVRRRHQIITVRQHAARVVLGSDEEILEFAKGPMLAFVVFRF